MENLCLLRIAQAEKQKKLSRDLFTGIFYSQLDLDCLRNKTVSILETPFLIERKKLMNHLSSEYNVSFKNKSSINEVIAIYDGAQTTVYDFKQKHNLMNKVSTLINLYSIPFVQEKGTYGEILKNARMNNMKRPDLPKVVMIFWNFYTKWLRPKEKQIKQIFKSSGITLQTVECAIDHLPEGKVLVNIEGFQKNGEAITEKMRIDLIERTCKTWKNFRLYQVFKHPLKNVIDFQIMDVGRKLPKSVY